MYYLVGLSQKYLRTETAFTRKFLKSIQDFSRDYTTTNDFTSLLSYIAIEEYSAIWVDWELIKGNSEKFVSRIQRLNAAVPVIIIVDGPMLDGQLLKLAKNLFTIVRKIKLFDRADELHHQIENFHELKTSIHSPFTEYVKPNGFGDFIGNSTPMLAIYKQIAKVSRTDFTVLILGDSGSGKEFVAQAIHNLSSRRSQKFVSLNCAAIPDNLLESELFGYEKGAFTGASGTKQGKFELADKGTIFLDEIGDMSIDLQAKLLRVLEDHRIERLGGTTTKQVNLRLIAATNQDLTQMIEEGDFRADLYYRLNVIPIHLPPLRDRNDDILLLTLYFLNRISKNSGIDVRAIAWNLINELQKLPLVGNVRELENLVTRLIFNAVDGILENQLIEKNTIPGPAEEIQLEDDGDSPFGDAVLPMWQVEAMAIKHALKNLDGNISRVATKLEISRTALYRKIKKYGLQNDNN